MSENTEYLSKRALLIIGIISLAILIIGVILFYSDLNEEFYVESGAAQTIFQAITYLGEPVVFIIIAAILYLGYNKRYAKNLAVCLLFSTYLNGLLKEIFEDPRPLEGNSDLNEDFQLKEVSYGFPSGHSQSAVSFWGYISYEFDEPKYKVKNYNIPIIPAILSIVIFLVAISRIIIGVHDLQDIIGGLLIGIGLLLLFIYAEPFITEHFNKLTFIPKLILVAVISLAAFLIGTFLFTKAGYISDVHADVPIYPDGGAFGQVGGVLFGFGIGYILEHEYVKYDPSALPNKKKIINVIIGLIIVILVFVPFEYLLEINSVFYRFARYAIMAFVLAFVVPLICTKLNEKK